MKENKLTKRQIQALHTKNKIYDTAIELMKEKDYQDIKIEEICSKAEISVGAFYHYFSSKNDFLTEMYSRADHYFQQEVGTHLTSVHTLDMIVEYFDLYAQYNEMIGISTMKQLYHSNNRLFIQKGRAMQTILQNIISKGQQASEVSSSMTSEDITEYLFISARGVIYDWCLHDGNYSLPEKMKQYMEKLVVIFKR